MQQLPYTLPSDILKFMSTQYSSQLENLKLGEPRNLILPTIEDYLKTIPKKFFDRYTMNYHNELLKIFQLLTNEGLVTPTSEGAGLYKSYQINGFDPVLCAYGYYDFIILGFQLIREIFTDSVRPIILDQGSKDRAEGIGTGFAVVYEKQEFFITARHCLPLGSEIKIPAIFPEGTVMYPSEIWVPENNNIDVAIIKFKKEAKKVSLKDFWIGSPNVLDDILTMGYPPIPGFTDAIQVSEAAQISSFLKATTGNITGEGQHYPGGKEDHFLISARVKGGNSGGPVINRKGEVVGVVMELLQDGEKLDLLGYGVAISSSVVIKMLNTILGKDEEMKIKQLSFQIRDHFFVV